LSRHFECFPLSSRHKASRFKNSPFKQLPCADYAGAASGCYLSYKTGAGLARQTQELSVRAQRAFRAQN